VVKIEKKDVAINLGIYPDLRGSRGMCLEQGLLSTLREHALNSAEALDSSHAGSGYLSSI